MITKSQLEAGGPLSFTMDEGLVEDLVISKVDGMENPSQAILDFTNKLNWYRVSFVFKHNESKKRFVPSFKNFSSTKKLRIRNGMNGGDGYSLKKIIISKSDRSHLVIKTDEIPNVLNFAFSLMGSDSFYFDDALKSSDITLSNNNLTATRTSNSNPYVSALLNREVLLSGNDKLYFEITVNNTSNSGIDAFGFILNTSTPTVFENGNVTLAGFPSGGQGPRVLIQGSGIYTQVAYGSAEGLQGGFSFGIGVVLGVAVDIGTKEFFFVRNGVQSNVFSFSNIIGATTNLFFAVGPYTINDQYTINSTPIYLPAGFNSAV